jgi:E3 ubiquitin-protein ligase HUWE1
LKASPRHTDRGTTQLIIPVLLAFKEEGGLDVLDSMLQVFASCVRQDGDMDSEESSKPKIASFGLKKVLDIYFILSNGKTVTEGSGGINLQRQTDRGQTVPNIFQQLVVELRSSILPSTMRLWDSSIVEKLAEPTVKRLIDILKLISAAENEPTSTPTDKVSTPYCQHFDCFIALTTRYF